MRERPSTITELFQEQRDAETRADSKRFLDTMSSEEVYEYYPGEENPFLGDLPPDDKKTSSYSSDKSSIPPLLIIAFCLGTLACALIFRFGNLGFASSESGANIVPQKIISANPSPTTSFITVPGPSQTIHVHDTQVVVREQTKTATATATTTVTSPAASVPAEQSTSAPTVQTTTASTAQSTSQAAPSSLVPSSSPVTTATPYTNAPTTSSMSLTTAP